jgi:hypothetical protein
MINANYLKPAAAGAVFLMTGACGGGGGVGSTPPPPPPPPTSQFDTAEYRASNSATTANALPAYNLGATGTSVKVAVVDTGINPNLSEFAGRIDSASRDVASNRGLTDTQGHGTMVSGVIAANRDNIYIHGVAPQAMIVSLNVGDPAGCRPGTSDCFLDTAIDDAINLAVDSGARVINMSFGDEEGMTADVWPAIQRAVDAGIIVVMAAGNDGTGAPNGFALQNIQNNGGSGLFIIAGAMDGNRNIANFSNRAGTGTPATWYLTALGVGNATVNAAGQHVNPNGTSFSTPTIVGAAALLAAAFPNLTGQQIVTLLLTNADDAGAAGTDTVFGRGILNIGRAFQPQGQMTLPGKGTLLSLTDNGVSSGPMGDALTRGGGAAILLDGYRRAYEVELGGTVRRVGQDQVLRQGLDTIGYQSAAGKAGPVSFNLTIKRDPAGGFRSRLEAMSLSRDDSRQARAVAGTIVTRLAANTIAAFGLSQSSQALQKQLAGTADRAFLVAEPMARTGFHADPSASVALRHQFGRVGLTASSERGRAWNEGPQPWASRPTYRSEAVLLDGDVGPARLGLGLTQLSEDRTILGARFTSLFASGGAKSTLLDASARAGLGNGWEMTGTYRHGWTDAGSVKLQSVAFSADVAKTGLLQAGDSFAIRLSQPLRVVRGGFVMEVPIAYSYAGETVTYGQRFLSLSPKGSELDLEMAYRTSLFGGSLDVNAFHRTDAGHVAAAKRDLGAALRFRRGL